MLRLQRENDDLAEELVASKVALRADMDKVGHLLLQNTITKLILA